MKKTSLIIFVLLVLVLSSKAVFAQENDELVQPKEVMEYQLPYSGLLPDNPLYSLKIFRDKVISFLISDPLKKSEFDLLQSEKRFSAGIGLYNKGKKDLGETTISKSINYLEEAFSKAQEAKKHGQDAHVIIDKLAVSIDKQEYLLAVLREKNSGKTKEAIILLGKRIADLENKVKSLKS